MFIKCYVIQFVILFLLTLEVDSQICERTETITRMVQETYLTTYTVRYRDLCPGGSYVCVKTRSEPTVNRRLIPQRQQKKIKYCCSGYIRVEDPNNDSNLICEAICMPACKNGYCKTPGVCACNLGYQPDIEDDHNCLPICEKVCDHGTCVAPNTCRCDFGYALVNGTCQPVCTEPCHNGTCVSPETCKCIPGYRKSESNVCEPYCSHGCDDNGFCAAPETCACNPGWNMTNSEGHLNEICELFCSKPCNNGTCVAPKTCECSPGYNNRSERANCVPQCKYPCGNGTCVFPNICSCFEGYQVDLHRVLLGFADGPLCVPFCTNCKGTCVAPNICETEEISTTSREDLCDVFQNCSTETDQGTISVDYSSEPTDTYNYYEEYEYKTNDDLDPIPNFVSSNASSNNVDNTHRNDTKEESRKPSWIQQHLASIIIPILVIVTAGIIMLLVWRWTPIIVYFKGRSYVVEGDPVDNGSYPFEDIQITSTDKETKDASK